MSSKPASFSPGGAGAGGSSVNSPLGVFALFISLAEAAFSFPVTQLKGMNQTIFVWFMVVFPFVVLLLFFAVLWD